MSKYIIKRLILLALTVIITVTVVFFLLELMKGYPRAIQNQILEAKDNATRQSIIDNYQEHGGVFTRFWNYVSGIFHGEFGTNYASPTKSISKTFIEPMKWTILVTGPAFLIGTIFGLIFGFISGYKRGKWPDILVNVIAILFVSIPSFILATFFVLMSDKIGWPLDYAAEIRDNGRLFIGLILPITIVSITSFSTLTYYIRNEVVEVLTSDYISIARAKGNSGFQIFYKHIIRNVSIPIVAIVLPSFISIIFGSLIIERFFGIPGSSHVFVGAFQDREKYIVLFSVVFFSGIGMLIKLAADIIYVFLDPRIRIAESTGWFQPWRLLKAYRKRRKEKIINKVFSKGGLDG